eukprot:TRINITY_DN13780_c0_g1_i1.p1 TRINITY_DN13780_c0_g1~~TRINITY_DN13780_c0_g1_i1.p1  ORF type:complete len:154 (+),score=31.27 TRINITY_DN13780_c0_g1_i1:89-550(+)
MRDDYITIFQLFDQDHDGVISSVEFRKILFPIVCRQQPGLNKAQIFHVIDHLFHTYDVDRDESLDMNEFVAFMDCFHTHPEDIQIRIAFVMYDTDLNGFIDSDELSNCFNAVYTNGTEEMLQSIMDVIDFNRDGKISFPEFKKLCTMIGETAK